MLNVTILPPITVVLLILAVGSLLARADTPKVSLGISWVLFLSIAVGVACKQLTLISDSYITSLTNMAKTLSSLGTALFVSVIGFISGRGIKRCAKGGICALFIGSLMSLLGILFAHGLMLLDSSLSRASMLGILCGALTSTPGLASVCELSTVATGQAVLAYSCAYLPGVVIAVFAARCAASRCKALAFASGMRKGAIGQAPFFGTLAFLSAGAATGSLLGNIKLPLLQISLGSTCGILLTSLLFGICAKRQKKDHSSEVLTALRNLGLSVFFVGTGLSAGLQLDTLYWRALLYGALLALFTVSMGYALLHLLKGFAPLHSGCILAGGMTSSPALGEVLRQGQSVPADQFSFAYLGALFTLNIILPLLG